MVNKGSVCKVTIYFNALHIQHILKLVYMHVKKGTTCLRFAKSASNLDIGISNTQTC